MDWVSYTAYGLLCFPIRFTAFLYGLWATFSYTVFSHFSCLSLISFVSFPFSFSFVPLLRFSLFSMQVVKERHRAAGRPAIRCGKEVREGAHYDTKFGGDGLSHSTQWFE